MGRWSPATVAQIAELNSMGSTAVEPRKHVIRVGGVDLQDHLGEFTVALEENLPTANARLTSTGLPAVDYFAPITISQTRGDAHSPMFGGSVLTAKVHDSAVSLEAAAMSDFRELALSALVASRVGAYDLIYMLARTSGFNDDRIQIDGGPPFALETFEVVIPVAGCSVSRAVDLAGGVRLLPRSAVDVDRFVHDESYETLASEFDECEAVAVVYVDGFRRMFAAEEAGWAMVRHAADWITVQLRNGSSHDVGGRLRAFDRAEARSTIVPLPVVLLTGLLTGRSWLRDRQVPLAKLSWDAARLAAVAASVPLTDSRSVLSYRSLARAADETVDPMERVAALWEALEFYAAPVGSDALFSKSEIKALVGRAKQGLTSSQTERVVQLSAQLNASSLIQRIWKRASMDGAPVTDSDREILKQMRQIRNDAVHGRTLKSPSREDLAYGVSLVARLLVHGAASTEQESRQ